MFTAAGLGEERTWRLLSTRGFCLCAVQETPLAHGDTLCLSLLQPILREKSDCLRLQFFQLQCQHCWSFLERLRRGVREGTRALSLGLLQTSLAIMRILATVPRSLQAHPSSQVAPFKALLQSESGASSALNRQPWGWAAGRDGASCLCSWPLDSEPGREGQCPRNLGSSESSLRKNCISCSMPGETERKETASLNNHDIINHPGPWFSLRGQVGGLEVCIHPCR